MVQEATPRQVVEEFGRLWVANPEAAFAFVAEDSVYRLNVDRGALELGGETRGREAIFANFMRVREVFDYLVYRPTILSADGDLVRVRTEIIYRHKASGELLTGFQRTHIRVGNGKICEVDEFVDAPMIESFMRMFAS